MSAFASRYARAFADVVISFELDTKAVDQQLKDFAATWHGSVELRRVMENPSVPVDSKIAILDKLSEKMGLTQQVRNFFVVLTDHGRISALDEVLAEYRKEIDARLGISEAHVTTARPLDDDERRELEIQISRLTGTRVHASFVQDNSILGGVIVRLGSTVYDGSVRGRLDKLKEALIAG
jgi:F-type H+-transporting ATPase subunit delta